MLVNTTFIYGLNDPETGECRYVGKADDPHDRLFGPAGHLKTRHKHHCANWIKSLVARGLVPALEILQEVPKTEWELWERVWIRASRKIGMNLVNGTDGGEGFGSGAAHPCFGRKATPGERKRMSETRSGENNPNFGNAWSDEARKKMSVAKTGTKAAPETRFKMRRKRKKASSAFFGVYKTRPGKWRAKIHVLGKNIFLGTFSDEVAAARAYDKVAKIHCGAHAKLNFP